MNTRDILRDLISFPTVSRNPNRDLIDYCAALLNQAGAEISIVEDKKEEKANLYATIGPRDRPGVLLSGHTDVVPIDGQDWTVPAFEMTEQNGKLYGRGTTDMKGFVASALHAACRASAMELATPLHLAFSYDEEIGCVGVRSLIDVLAKAPFRPLFCIVGEPTSLAVATGHKGKTACHVSCKGHEAHSSVAPDALNAIHLACDMISFIRNLQDEVCENHSHDQAYDIPYTTLHVGNIQGGVALNIVPGQAGFDFEIRNLPEDNPDQLLARIAGKADELLANVKPRFPDAAINMAVTNRYPALSTPEDESVVSFVKSLRGTNDTIKVAFGTEGGLFSSELAIPTVVCGPGSMEQGHKPDEFITLDQLEMCDEMLETLLGRLQTGL
ncbi:MAG: acetylornithine deacetylase [Rhizobiaceae bacterium]|nr:acetylornithine deacetylase [Rhizobiaceae bacterium]